MNFIKQLKTSTYPTVIISDNVKIACYEDHYMLFTIRKTGEYFENILEKGEERDVFFRVCYLQLKYGKS